MLRTAPASRHLPRSSRATADALGVEAEELRTRLAASKDKLYEAARLYATSKKSMILYGLGVSEHRTGTEGAIAIANLALVCGQIGRDSTGVNTLRGQNNVQGASDLGPLPHKLPGYQDIGVFQCAVFGHRVDGRAADHDGIGGLRCQGKCGQEANH